MKLLMKHMGYLSYREACDDVREFFGGHSHIKPIPREQRVAMGSEVSPEVIEANRNRILKFWDEAVDVRDGDPVSRYIQNRVPGTDLMLHNLRLHRSLAYWAPPAKEGERPVKLGEFPAMLALAHDADGNVAQLHKTFLTPDGFKANVPIAKKADYGTGTNCFAVRMMEPIGNTLGICEGLETGWAAGMLRNVPVWPCLNGPVMGEFKLPQELRGQIRHVVIFADSDELKPAGRLPNGQPKMQRAGSVYAEKAKRNLEAQRVRATVLRPARVGEDFADFWLNENKQAA
jgi:putative DNA primase/helicase